MCTRVPNLAYYMTDQAHKRQVDTHDPCSWTFNVNAVNFFSQNWELEGFLTIKTIVLQAISLRMMMIFVMVMFMMMFVIIGIFSSHSSLGSYLSRVPSPWNNNHHPLGQMWTSRPKCNLQIWFCQSKPCSTLLTGVAWVCTEQGRVRWGYQSLLQLHPPGNQP